MKAWKSRDEFLDNFNTNFHKHFPVAGIEPRISDAVIGRQLVNAFGFRRYNQNPKLPGLLLSIYPPPISIDFFHFIYRLFANRCPRNIKFSQNRVL